MIAVSCVSKINSENPQTDELTPAAGATIYGKVMCGERPLKNVSVSDGVTVVRTNSDGVYNINSSKINGHVFISIPSGYTMAEASLPSAGFWKSLSKPNEFPERVDFALEQEDQSYSTVIVMGDIQIFNASSITNFKNTFISEVNKYLPLVNMWPVYGLTLGDMTWDWYWYNGEQVNMINYILAMKGLNGLRVFNTVGNHDNDMQYDSWTEFLTTGEDRTCMNTYRDMLGPTCYSYNIGGVHFVSLDDVITTNTGGTTVKDSRGNLRGITKNDMKWLQEDLSYVSEDTPVIVSVHLPLFDFRGKAKKGNSDSVNATLEAIAAPFKKFKKVLFLSGHTHFLYNTLDYNVDGLKVTEWNSGALCGNFWTTANKTGLNLCTDGTPGGYRILSVKGGEFSSIYKGVGKKQNYLFRAYDRNQMNLDASKLGTYTKGDIAGENKENWIYINVWDYKPSWKITVQEFVTNSATTLNVTRMSESYDPLYMLMYEQGKTDTTPQLTTTMFKVRANSATSTVTIKVEDEYGNSRIERMVRPKQFTIDTYIDEQAE